MKSPTRPRPAGEDVAVVIAAYNAVATVAVATRSALAQGEATEVWVVDDGSTDGTAEAAEACEDGTGRLRVIRQAINGGPSAARNVALEGTRATWICVLDADDRFTSGRLAKLLAAAGDAELVADAIVRVASLTDDPLANVAAAASPLNWTGIDLAGFIEGNVSRRGRQREELGFIKPLMSTAFLRRHRIRYDPDLRLGEDFLLYAQVLAHGGRLRLGPPCGYLALTRVDSLSGRHSIQDLAALRNCTAMLGRIRTLTPAERSAIRRHWRSVDDRLQWRRLIEAVKSRNAGAALSAFHDLRAAIGLFGKLAEQAWLRGHRRLSFARKPGDRESRTTSPGA